LLKKRRKRVEAVERAAKVTFEISAHVGQGLRIEDVPSLEVVSALSDAMFRRETGKASSPDSRRGWLSPHGSHTSSTNSLARQRD
jgi:hypothetical protein